LWREINLKWFDPCPPLTTCEGRLRLCIGRPKIMSGKKNCIFIWKEVIILRREKNSWETSL